MKSLYNKSGILPALFTNSRIDCGIAWSEHRSQHPAGNARMKLQVSCDPAAISAAYDKAISAVERFKKIMTETTKPIDPQTIQVGDTVRLVGSRTITECAWRDEATRIGTRL